MARKKKEKLEEVDSVEEAFDGVTAEMIDNLNDDDTPDDILDDDETEEDSDKPKKRAQTKEEQAKKKEQFNSKRVEWFDAYMKGELPTLYQMRISPDRSVVLSPEEQIAMSQLIQAGIAAKIMLSEIARKLGRQEIHLQKTIANQSNQILSMLREIGYTTDFFVSNTTNRRRAERIYQDAENARNLFAEKNLGLVTMIAGRRKKTTSTAANVEFDDLVAEGMCGLMIAIDQFNPSLGNLFSTPAAWWIDQPIRTYLDSKTKTIHMPTHMNNVYKAIHFATRALREIYPDDADITDEKIAEYCANVGRSNITVEKIQEAKRYRRETVSFDAPVGDSGPNDKALSELLEDDENIELNVTDSLSEMKNVNRILALIENDKKREILRDWYTSTETHDLIILSNVSRKHCLTKERVRQLKQEAELEVAGKIAAQAKLNGTSAYDAFSEMMEM